MKCSTNQFILLLIFLINVIEAALLQEYEEDDIASYEYK
jgi:hypothetical protein